MNLDKHPILMQMYRLIMEIEELGASDELTRAVIMAGDVMTEAGKLVDQLQQGESHKEVAARIMQLESVIDQAKSAMVAHVGLCGHLRKGNDGCFECFNYHAKTCPIRMFLAGVNHPKAWEPVL